MVCFLLSGTSEEIHSLPVSHLKYSPFYLQAESQNASVYICVSLKRVCTSNTANFP